MNTIVRAVSSAEVHNLTNAPKVIVPGVVGHLYSIIHAVIEYIAGSIPYTTDDETKLSLQLGDASGSPLDSPFNFIPTNGFLTATTNQVMRLTANPGYDMLPTSLAGGVGVYLTTNGSDVMNGNGTLKVTVAYEDILL